MKYNQEYNEKDVIELLDIVSRSYSLIFEITENQKIKNVIEYSLKYDLFIDSIWSDEMKSSTKSLSELVG